MGLAVLSLFLFYNAAQGSFLIFFGEIFLNFISIRFIIKLKRHLALLLTVVMVTFNLSILFYFKYINFFFFELLGKTPLFAELGAIPPGISFYTFQIIACLIDTYRHRDMERITFLDYLNFTAFFPQIVAGPIERRDSLLPQVQRFRFKFDPDCIDQGMRWFMLGMFMKIVLADNLAAFIDLDNTSNPYVILLSTYLFGLRIYFDFAGYSFIALGIARVFGVRLTINFRSPYIARNIREFWQRWHVTLSNWFRDYLFIPLGGSRVYWVALNILIVFVVSGLWHGAGWNFIVWGAYHGILLVLYHYCGKFLQIPSYLAWGCNYVLAMFGWLFFMETDWSRLLAKLTLLFTWESYSLAGIVGPIGDLGKVNSMVLFVSLFLAHMLLSAEHIARTRYDGSVAVMLESSKLPYLLVPMIFLFSARGQSQFVYFAF
jgi:alginate O-acetyltransferase complex protein AlgI